MMTFLELLYYRKFTQVANSTNYIQSDFPSEKKLNSFVTKKKISKHPLLSGS